MLNRTEVILKNTFYLYFRMIVLTLISIFTYRVVFNALGAADYGTYNVVGGCIGLFGFLSGTLIIVFQRDFAVAFGEGNKEKLNETFSVSLGICAGIAIIILLIAETAGLWFVMNKLNLDYSRSSTIFLIYQISIALFVLEFLKIPFEALILADEKFSVYSLVAIMEGIAKVAVAYTLYIVNENKLDVYAWLMFGVGLAVWVTYITNCLYMYRFLKFYFCKDIEKYNDVFSLFGWNLIGALAAIGKSQGVNIILNIFFGTVINAARAIAFQLRTIIMSFSQNFLKAVDPQIIKAYASHDDVKYMKLISASAKSSYFLLLIVALPFILNCEYVLTLWLGAIPQYTVLFAQLALIDVLILSIADPFYTAVMAIGKIRSYQLTVGIISLLNLPLSFLLLEKFNNPVVPFVVAIGLSVLIDIARLINFKLIYKFSIMNFIKKAVWPMALITGICVFLGFEFFSKAKTFGCLCFNVSMTVLILSVLIYGLALDDWERSIVKGFVSRLVKKYGNSV